MCIYIGKTVREVEVKGKVIFFYIMTFIEVFVAERPSSGNYLLQGSGGQ